MKTLTPILVAVLITGCADRAAQPGGVAPVIVLNGRVAADEWGVSSPARADGDVQVLSDDQFVYIAVRSNATMPVHLYLARADVVHVLHSSASLGRAVYRSESGSSWVLTEPFDWEVLDPALGRDPNAPPVEEERSAYLERNGWAASTMLTGTPGETEFAVARDYVEGFETFAVSYILVLPDSTEEIGHWPESGMITPREYDLLMGENVAADFAPGGWAAVSRLLDH